MCAFREGHFIYETERERGKEGGRKLLYVLKLSHIT